MASTKDIPNTSEDPRVQIARLREQVETLLKDRVTPAVSEFAGKAESAMHSASDTVKEQADVLAGRVKAQPLVAVLIAAGVGWVVGRMMR